MLIGAEGVLVAVWKELDGAWVVAMLVDASRVGGAVTLPDMLRKESTTRIPKMSQQKNLASRVAQRHAIRNEFCVWKCCSTQCLT